MLQRIEVDLESIMTDQEICPLCNEGLINRAVAVDCEHAFCHACLQGHLESSDRCPTCRAVIGRYVTNIDKDFAGDLFQAKEKGKEEEKQVSENRSCLFCRQPKDACDHGSCCACIQRWPRTNDDCPTCGKRFSGVDNENGDGMSDGDYGRTDEKPRCVSEAQRSMSRRATKDIMVARRNRAAVSDLTSMMREVGVEGQGRAVRRGGPAMRPLGFFVDRGLNPLSCKVSEYRCGDLMRALVSTGKMPRSNYLRAPLAKHRHANSQASLTTPPNAFKAVRIQLLDRTNR